MMEVWNWVGWCPQCEANTLVVVELPGDPSNDTAQCTTCPWWNLFLKEFWKDAS